MKDLEVQINAIKDDMVESSIARATTEKIKIFSKERAFKWMN